ncbi:MAG: ARMT1-like domain-containing protein [Nitrospirota bacterium]|nr:ARMT1-like domain-containing protein [Nitrospirota bacterium]
MKTYLDCFPCFLRQVVIALSQVSVDETLKVEILKETLEDIRETDTSKTPAHATTFIHRKIRELLGCDPFKEIKQRYNRIALGLYPSLKSLVDDSPDPLWTASRLAIAGNVIDFGIYKEVDIEAEINRSLRGEIVWDDYADFRASLDSTEEVLYLIDNAGEIVFDRILIETIRDRGKRVTAVVKGGPVINDSTVEDAFEVGLQEICEIKDNGSDAIGTILEWCSEEFTRLFYGASLIISKGQGNFETLMNVDKEVFFLFQAKCDVVSGFLGVTNGSMLLVENRKLFSRESPRMGTN